MKRYFKEDFDPAIYNSEGEISIDNPAVVDAINANLDAETYCSFITPYVGLEKIRKILAYYKIFIPKSTVLDQNHGNDVFEISQFGMKMGMKDNGEVVTKDDSSLVLYFEWSMNKRGMYDIFASIVDQDDLEEILSDYESEVEDDETDLQEQTSIADHTKHLYRIVNNAKAAQHRNEVEKLEQDAQVKEETLPNLRQKMASKMREKSVTLANRMQSEDSTWGVKEPQRKKGQYASEDGKHVVKIHKRNDEYVVSLHKDGKHREAADYFTDDKEDAHATAKDMLKRAQNVNEEVDEKQKERNWKRTQLFAKVAKASAEKMNKKDLEGANKKLNQMKRIRKKLSEPDEMNEVSKEWLDKKASYGFDLAHAYRWNNKGKRAEKKIEQIKSIQKYIAKKGMKSKPTPTVEPDELQKRYDELKYKGD
jgi:hypothetical protein